MSDCAVSPFFSLQPPLLLPFKYVQIFTFSHQFANLLLGTAERSIRIAASIRKLLTQLTTGLLSQCQCQVEGAVLCQLLAQWGAGPAFTRFTTITTTIAAATTG